MPRRVKDSQSGLVVGHSILGRIDSQLKVHGRRIEPGEIESVLMKHSEVQAAAVVVPESGPRRLIGCIVPVSPELSVEFLRSHAATYLPDYLVPVRFIFLEAFPLTSNGNVDRAELSRRAVELVDTNVAVPDNPASEEGIVCQMVSNLIGVSVSAKDHLVDLGLDSVMLIQLCNRLQAQLGNRPSLEALFANPSVGEVARLCSAEQRLS